MNKSTKNKIFRQAVEALKSKLPITSVSAEITDSNAFIIIEGKCFRCFIDPVLTVGQIAETEKKALAYSPHDYPVVYMTANISGRTMEYAEKHDINIIDCAGNFRLHCRNEDETLLFFFANKGEMPVDMALTDSYPIFKEAGIKVIFYFLLDRDNIRLPYRKIQEATGVAIGTVKNIIDGMTYHRFVRKEGKSRFLTEIDRLLVLWTAAYGMTLKSKLIISKMSFRNESARKEWKKIILPNGMAWGSEPAAALTDNYLTPGDFTIYTDVTTSLLLRTGSVIPDINGDITICEKFWRSQTIGHTVPPLLIYADLMNTGNGRCIEAAEKIKKDELKYLL